MMNKLHKPRLPFLSIKQLKPQGWLKDQLRIQADGLSGNLDKFWPDIKDSAWIGGSADGWERVPYWLDGFIPLAWLLDDEEMKVRAKKYIDEIIRRQDSDGWLCPTPPADKNGYDLWAFFLILKVLVVYYDATEDDRIEGTVEKALKAVDKHIDSCVLFNWAQFRWFEALISIYWLYERTGEDWLLYLASKLRGQGFDWISFFKLWPYQQPDKRGRWSQMSHVVNNAMMLKSGALLWRLTGAEEHLYSANEMVEKLDTYHGMVTGVFTGDECLAGKSPIQGTELCSVVEYMYSLEHLLSISGDSKWGDRLEKIAYNALPATFSPDMWTHQYDQQVNQVACIPQEHSIFLTNNGESHTFGLEPNFGCCTANLSQGWPKLALSTFMESEDGIAATVYAPSCCTMEVNGVSIVIEEITDYPFKDNIEFIIKTQEPVFFKLKLRVPAWAEGATYSLDNECVSVSPGAFASIDRIWHNETRILLRLPMKPILNKRPADLYSVEKGPLVYALPIGERWEQIHEDAPYREFPHCDYAIYPTTSWNYGLRIDANSISKVSMEEKPMSRYPFSPKGSPVAMKIRGSKVDWSLSNEHKTATPTPNMSWTSDDIEELTLIPYGCTNLRLTEMPLLPTK